MVSRPVASGNSAATPPSYDTQPKTSTSCAVSLKAGADAIETSPQKQGVGDILSEHVIRLNRVPHLPPPASSGRRVGISSVYRWCDRGVRGVRLEYAHAPWGRITSVEAVERFLRRLGGDTHAIPMLTPARRRREQVRAANYVRTVLGLTGAPEGGAE